MLLLENFKNYKDEQQNIQTRRKDNSRHAI